MNSRLLPMTDTLPRWRVTARRELTAIGRSWLRWLGLGILLLAAVGPIAVWGVTETTVTASGLVNSLTGLAKGVLPVLAIAAGYSAVIYERQSGGVLLSLSVPQSRGGYLLGKFLSRSILIGSIVGGALAVGGGVTMALWPVDLSTALRYPGFVVVTLGFGLVFVSIAVVASAVASTGRRVFLAAFGGYLVVGPLWSGLTSLLVQILFRFDQAALTPFPDWGIALQFCSPAQAYGYLVTTLYGFDPSIHYSLAGDAWFITPWTALLVVGAWIVVPLVLGYVRFRRMALTTA